ncbi:MAG: Ig-like domain-containing protein [Candidatus Sericytochromatia bacterium]|nr:Ig-like domain-containing protein [Candidatus Tanganyikabacteria bacterium]
MTPTGRRGPLARLFPTFTLSLLAFGLALAACEQTPGTGGRIGAQASPGAGGAGKASPTPTIDPLQGTSGTIGGTTPAPGQTTSPAATPTPTATPSPTPTPTPTAPPAVAQTVSITPNSGPALTLNLPAPAGATPLANQPTQVEVQADVQLNNGAIDSKTPKWTSTDTLVATVSAVTGTSKGLVKAVAKIGTAKITATSDDGKASASVTVTVKSTGQVNVGVE